MGTPRRREAGRAEGETASADGSIVSNQDDVELAKRLMKAGLVPADGLRQAFTLQERVREEKGQHVALPRVLYHLGLLAKGSLDAAVGPGPLATQPFPGYRLESVLGEGGTSVVYAGTYLENGAPVAVKVLDPILALKEGWIDRFRLEARILIDVEHPNVILGYEVGEAAGLHYFTMERIDGITAEDILARRGRLECNEALWIVLQMARALGALHEAGYLHRDVKPNNVIVQADGRAVMIDLGFTQALDPSVGEDTPLHALTVGTVEYLSPEQARGRQDLDPRADIYSLGVSLYHLVVGEVPFQGASQEEVLAMQVLGSIDAQKLKQRHITPEVQFFIAKMMSKDRARRYETMDEVARELTGYVPEGGLPVDLGPAPQAPPPVLQPIAPPAAPKPQRPASPAAPRPPAVAPLRKAAAPAPEPAPDKPAAPVPKRAKGKPEAPVPRRRRDRDDPPGRRRR